MYFKKGREFIVEEENVTTLLTIINNHRRFYVTHVGNCGWADDVTKWFVMFDATDKVFYEIVKELASIGKISASVRPGGMIDLCFEKEES